jgi:choline dehydrogenase-like flavoprotein
VIELMLSGMPDDQRHGLLSLLEALAEQGFGRSSLRSREQIMRNVTLMGPEAAAGIGALTSLTLFLFYGLPDERGQNPSWRTFGYPGPVSPPPQVDRPIRPLIPAADLTLEADVCIVGSGAGGGVMAGELSAKGLKVVVLEAGGYFDDADFNQLELPAYQNLYWRGGPSPTADLNVSLQAGFCLGGGTVVNWTNSLRTTRWVREQWEREFGLEGLAGAEFDRHLDAVWKRLSVNDRCSELNGSQQRMQAGAEKLGWRFALANRNTDEQRYSFETAGFMGFGDQSGAKQSTTKTYLQDAYDRDAVLVTRCWAERILTEHGRAAGVQATWSDPQTGRSAAVTVRAAQVVVACGALESPALLLRSGIGGPAAGQYLRLHPCTATVGFYDGDQEAWKGAPHAGLVPEFENIEDGHGFLIEGAQYTTAVAATAVPYSDGTGHKRLMSDFRHGASFIALLRDRGHGRVTIDQAGMAVPSYALTDELDHRNAKASIAQQARLHEAAGARQILAAASRGPVWRSGDDLGAFIARGQRIPLGAGGWRLFSAHQMGTCRMGEDPSTSVAGPWGELHDTAGVWIGDASAFPTASGTNPMITIMGLAHRTAEAVAAASPATTGSAAAPSPASAPAS